MNCELLTLPKTFHLANICIHLYWTLFIFTQKVQIYPLEHIYNVLSIQMQVLFQKRMTNVGFLFTHVPRFSMKVKVSAT